MEYGLLGELTLSNLINFVLVMIVVAIARSASKYITSKLDGLLDEQSRAKEHFATRLDTISGVNEIMDNLICHYKSDRTTLLEFHNGGTNICGLPFAKVSCTHERCSIGTKLAAYHIKDYPIALFGYLISSVLNSKRICIPDIDGIKQLDATTYQFWSENGAKALYAKLVKTLTDEPIGLLIMEFNTVQKMNEDALDELDKSAYAIGVLHSVKE